MRRRCTGLSVVGYALLVACADVDPHPAGVAASPVVAQSGGAFEDHLQSLRQRLSPKLTLVAKRPFVVIGDGPPKAVVDVADRIVANTMMLLKKDFFELDPEVTDIWLLHDARAYRAVTQRIFNAPPSTPFGFYSPARRVMVMNLATGSGTLVHEMVHPFLRRNFPSCPSWFDEGLASLYERPSTRDQHIVGLINWRLTGLRRAINNGSLPNLTTMMTLDSDGFYQSSTGDNYAEARYLLYYLQEHGMLQSYYKLLHETVREDPSGVTALERMLDEPDLNAFDARWRAWVLELHAEG